MTKQSPTVPGLVSAPQLSPSISVAIADDHLIVLEGLVAMININTTHHIVFTATDGQELLTKIKNSVPDVLILDLDLPVLSGFEVYERLRADYPDLKIIILTGYSEKELVVDYFKKGVNAFLQKGCSSDDLLLALEKVHRHGRYLNKLVEDLLIEAAWDKRPEEKIVFTERELAVIKLICEDKSSKEIAQTLMLNVRTVEHDRRVILTKIKARSVSAIVRYAIKHKLVKP